MLSDEEIVKLIMRHVPKGGRILEIGCGSGDVSLALARETENIIYGVDSSKSAIFEAKRRSSNLKNIFFEVMRAEELNFPDNFFNLIYSVRTLHETKAKESLGEMYRVLVPGGRLIIIDWTKEAAASWSEKSFDPEELEGMLSHIGFTHFSIKVKNDFYELVARK
jgi:ubiquinone/menaquinone biosynthesis C-methylase UbiE